MMAFELHLSSLMSGPLTILSGHGRPLIPSWRSNAAAAPPPDAPVCAASYAAVTSAAASLTGLT